jgi:hypothetical protein
MGALRDQLTAQIADLTAELKRHENNMVSLRARLGAQLEALEDAQEFLTDRLEGQVLTLQKMGLLGPIKGK